MGWGGGGEVDGFSALYVFEEAGEGWATGDVDDGREFGESEEISNPRGRACVDDLRPHVYRPDRNGEVHATVHLNAVNEPASTRYTCEAPYAKYQGDQRLSLACQVDSAHSPYSKEQDGNVGGNIDGTRRNDSSILRDALPRRRRVWDLRPRNAGEHVRKKHCPVAECIQHDQHSDTPVDELLPHAGEHAVDLHENGELGGKHDGRVHDVEDVGV